MSGIAGLWRLDGRPIEPPDLDRMLERLAHRGPDLGEAQRAVRGSLALGAHGESLAEAPGTLLITADLRLDNRTELVNHLGGRHADDAVSDVRIVLAAYERWAERCVEHLIGDFAFALWDERRNQLFCARDHLGCRPFYYHHAPGRLFAFGSEIKGLIALSDVPRRVNEVRVADYLASLFDDKACTFYQDVVRLPPAHTLVVSQDGIRLREYWRLDPMREVRLAGDAAYAEAFREIFNEAVRCRLRATPPVGALLSGGLDSSSIVCVARALLSPDTAAPLHTFSLVFDDVPQCDERPFIQAVLDRDGLEPHFVRGDRVDPLTDLDAMLDAEDEPFYAPNLFLHWALYREARRAGVRTLLDGIDGDTTLRQSPDHLGALFLSGRWRSLWGEVRGLARRRGVSPKQVFKRHVLRPIAPPWVRDAWRALRTKGPLTFLTRTDFARRVGQADRVAASLDPPGLAWRDPRRDHGRRLSWGLIPFALEVADRAAAVHGIEPRYPFFDRRLVEFCLALPPEQKLHRGWSRIVLRRALAGTLPEEVRWRPGKTSLAPNFDGGLMHTAAPVVEHVLANPGPAGEYLDLKALRQAHERFVARRASKDALSVWIGLTLAVWLERHFAGPSESAIPAKEVAYAAQ